MHILIAGRFPIKGKSEDGKIEYESEWKKQ